MNSTVFERATAVGEIPELAAATETPISAVSWAAILAGALVAAAVSVVMLTLGSGLGFAALSAWPGSGASATSFALSTGIWLLVVQWVAAAFGGYLTGRLRTRWVGTHTHEVFFRDTAHGFVTWAVATVMVAVIVSSAGAAALGAGARAAGAMASTAATGLAASGPAAGAGAGGLPGSAQTTMPVTPYVVDAMFRPERAEPGQNGADPRAEAARILVNGMETGAVPAADRTYLSQLVALRTGLSQPDAQKRVDDTLAQVKAAEVKVRAEADTARKAAATASIFTALSLVIGAFIASVAAAVGGRRRDEHR